MQYQILKFYQSIQNPVLSFIANLLSFAGEQTILVVVAIIFLFGVSKKKAFSFITSMMFALMTTNGLKAVFRSPRPFVVHKDLIADRVETAGGYSFPSGHTTTATSFYISVAKTVGSRILMIFAFILSLFIGLSRNYLLVHWPIDVLVGYIIGTVFALCLTGYVMKRFDDKNWVSRFCLITGILSGIFSLVMTPLMTFGAVDTLAFSSLTDMTILSAGIYLGFFLEEKYIDFKECDSVKMTALNTLLCVIVILIIFAVSSLIPEKYFRHLFRLSLIGFAVSYLYPLFAVKTGLLKTNEKKR